MTRAKPNHLAARALAIEHLDMHPGKAVDADLDPAEVGIVGSAGHVRTGTSYHIGRNDLIMSKQPYSVVESARDRRGLDDYASAMDIGYFRVATPKGVYDLRHFSLWLVRLCRAGDPDTRDIREVIYSPDGRTVHRWDALGRRSSGDDSHLTHTHVSEYRDADGSRMLRLVRRYLVEIGLLAGEDDDMLTEEQIIGAVVKGVHSALKQAAAPAADRSGATGRQIRGYLQAILGPAVDLEALDGDELAAVLAGPAGQALADRVIAGLGGKSPADVAQALVAAGQDPGALAAALTALAADPDRRRG